MLEVSIRGFSFSFEFQMNYEVSYEPSKFNFGNLSIVHDESEPQKVIIINFRQVCKSDLSMHSGVFAFRISPLSDFGTDQLQYDNTISYQIPFGCLDIDMFDSTHANRFLIL